MKKILLLILVMSLALTSGCWDMQEIEQRHFVVEMGVDINQEAESLHERFTVTYQYPNINALGEGGGDDQKSYLLTTNYSSIFGAAREFMEESPFPFYYKNLKVVILGEEILKERELIMSILDELGRSTRVNKRVRILAAEGTAKEMLEANYIQEQWAEGTVYSTVRDNDRISSFTSKSLLNLIQDFNSSNVSIIPKITSIEDGFRVSGGSILKDYKFLDWVTSHENIIINMINNDLGLESIDVPYKGSLITFGITQSSTGKEVDHNDQVKIKLNVNLEGFLEGHMIREGYSHYKDEEILEMERAIEDDVKFHFEETLAHLQEISADVIGVGEYLSKFHPAAWKNYEDEWDDIFSEAEFDINIVAKIRRVGLTK